MQAYVASSSSHQSFQSSFPLPVIGDLHRQYSNLPSSCEYLIKVHASSINPSDENPLIVVYPHVMGSDMSGEVVTVGPTCSKLKVGDQVWGDIGANTMTSGGAKTKELGGYGEYTLALETQLGVMPSNINFLEAASLPKVALTSYKAYWWYAGGQNNSKLWDSGPTVLVLGGSGGTGTTGIQLAKAFGAKTVITTTSAANFDYCRSLGADQLIDYKTQNWWQVLASNSVDVVYDTVGEAGTGDNAMDKIRPGGYYVTIAGALASHPKPGVNQSSFINSDTNLSNLAEMEALRVLIEADKLRMKRIDGVFPLDQVSQAFNVSRGGHVVGKLVVSIFNKSVTY